MFVGGGDLWDGFGAALGCVREKVIGDEKGDRHLGKCLSPYCQSFNMRLGGLLVAFKHFLEGVQEGDGAVDLFAVDGDAFDVDAEGEVLGIGLIEDGAQVLAADFDGFVDGDGGIEDGLHGGIGDADAKPAHEFQGAFAATGNEGKNDARGGDAFVLAELVIVAQEFDGGGCIVNGLGDEEAAAVARFVEDARTFGACGAVAFGDDDAAESEACGMGGGDFGGLGERDAVMGQAGGGHADEREEVDVEFLVGFGEPRRPAVGGHARNGFVGNDGMGHTFVEDFGIGA